MKKLKIKLEVIYKIIIGKYKHFVIINVDDKNLVKLSKGEDFNVNGKYYGLSHYCYLSMIKCLSNNIDEIDMICEKAHDEAYATEIKKSKLWRVMCLKNYNVVEKECIAPYYRCLIIGWIWRYVPDLTFKKRRYMIVDA